MANETGATAITFAVLSTVVFGFAGLAIDGGRALSQKTQAQNALDDAVLAAVGRRTEAEARSAFDGVLAAKGINPDKVSYARSFANSQFRVSAGFDLDVPTTLSNVVGVGNIKVSVASEAGAISRPTQIELAIREAYGWSNKDVEFWAQRPNGSSERFARITYRLTDKTGANNRGIGTTVAWPSTKVDIGEFVKIWVTMNVDVMNSGRKVTFGTNDPRQSNHFFIDKRQLATGESASVTRLMPCGRTTEYAVEDTVAPLGDNDWSTQDIFFGVTVGCESPDNNAARLLR